MSSIWDDLRPYDGPAIFQGFSNTQTRVQPMANEAAKLKFLHKKIIDRYLEGPNSADEEILKLMDLGVTNPQSVYLGVGHNEHPIYIRDQWVSQVAAKTTDEGYWAWVSGKINADKTYRITASGIHERAETEAIWSLDQDLPYAMPGPGQATAVPAMPTFPAPPFPPLPSPFQTATAPLPRPRNLTTEDIDSLMRVTAADIAPVRIQL